MRKEKEKKNNNNKNFFPTNQIRRKEPIVKIIVGIHERIGQRKHRIKFTLDFSPIRDLTADYN